MQKKHLYLDKYMWQIDVFIIDFCHEADRVISSIDNYSIVEKIGTKIKECGINTGMTFSKGRKSIIVIGRSTNAGQFFNTLIHELFHLAKHIAKYYDLDPYGEELAYLVGDVSCMIYDITKKYMCNCCRNE